MLLWILMFALGFCAGYVLLSLERRKRLFGWERKMMIPVAWALASALIMLAALLLLGGLAGWL